MAFTVDTFIGAYNSTDKYISILKSNGDRFLNLNVCQNRKNVVEGTKVIIYQESNKSFTLTFPSTAEATEAHVLLQETIEELSPNCAIEVNITAEGIVITPLTYAAYKAAAAAGTLTVLGYYDVTDAADVLGLGISKVFRVQALYATDYAPIGELALTGENIQFNTKDDIVVYYHDVENSIELHNNSTLTNTGTITFVKASENSTMYTTGTCSYIVAENNSILNTTNCSYITALNNSNLVIEDSNNVVVNNITANVSSYGAFTNIVVDKTNSIGKQGKTTITEPEEDLELIAYQQTIRQEFIDADTAIIVDLINPFAQAHAVFRLKITSLTENITVKDAGTDSTLVIITPSNAGEEFVFEWNTTTGEFEYIASVFPLEQRIDVTVGSDGQTTFAGVASPLPLNPDSAKLFINGNRSYTFSLSGGDLIYTASLYALETTDHVILEYY